MPVISVNRKELEKEIGDLEEEKLKERISMLGTDLESIDEEEIKVEVFPNRPDMLSQQGFGRALASFIGVKKGLRGYEKRLKDSGVTVKVDESVKNCRPYTACAVVKKLNLDDEKIREVIELQEKLHTTYGRNRKKTAIGIYPLENITPPIHFKGLKPENIEFVPLESEEEKESAEEERIEGGREKNSRKKSKKRELSAEDILEEHPKGREYSHLVEDLERYACFLDDEENIMSFTPIINSNLTGRISEDTEEVFIECSGFDLETLEKALNIIVTSFADMGAEVHSVDVVYPDFQKKMPDLSREEMELRKDYVEKYLGEELTGKNLEDLFERMGYGVKEEGEESVVVEVPCFRTDVLHPIDLVEDLAISYGYENFPSEKNDFYNQAVELSEEQFYQKVREVLLGKELIEVKKYHLVNKEMQTEKMDFDYDVVELKNPVSEEYDSLRFWLVPGLLECLEENKHYEHPQKIFEIGKVFSEDQEKNTKVQEDERVAVAVCSKEADYTRARQLLELVLNSFEVEAVYSEADHPSFLSGRVARVRYNGEGVAYVGEVKPEVLSNFSLEMPVSVVELNLSELYRQITAD